MENQKQIQIFNNAEFGEIRSMEIGGEPRCKIKRTDFGFEWNKSKQKRR